jgi:hypothetical protein
MFFSDSGSQADSIYGYLKPHNAKRDPKPRWDEEVRIICGTGQGRVQQPGDEKDEWRTIHLAIPKLRMEPKDTHPGAFPADAKAHPQNNPGGAQSFT